MGCNKYFQVILTVVKCWLRDKPRKSVKITNTIYNNTTFCNINTAFWYIFFFNLNSHVLLIAPPPAVASEIVHQDALAYLKLVCTWARLFHVSASGGLDLSQQSPKRRKVGLWNSLVHGRRYVTSAKWVTEVGHWLDWVPAPAASHVGTSNEVRPRNQSSHWPPSSFWKFLGD